MQAVRWADQGNQTSADMNDQGNTFGNTFGYWLRRRRKALDLTQEALAARVSCSQAAIKKIEADERRPSRGLALRLAEHLLVPALERAAFLEAARVPKATGALHLDKLPVDTTAAAAEDAHDPTVHEGDLHLPFVGRAIEFGQFTGLLTSLRRRRLCGADGGRGGHRQEPPDA